MNLNNEENKKTSLSPETVNIATQHINDILALAMMHTAEHRTIVVYDTQCPLAIALMTAYQRCLPTATFINFELVTHEAILAALNNLKPSDLVVLIQSTNFRLGAFRIRIELFKKCLKVIEHPHLMQMPGIQGTYYIDSLAYDPSYYRDVGRALKARIDNAKSAIIDSGGERLIFDSPLEPAKLNIGDYTDMQNIGGQFPIGEVFTEAQNLESVNGRVRIFVFGDTAFKVNKPEKPITLIVSKGRVIDATDSTLEFDRVLANIRADEGEVWLRELGFGMNKAFSQNRTVDDIGTYERMCGIHLSLGGKHGVYKKNILKRIDIRHHVDVFAVTECVYLDNNIIFKDGAWIV
jgi:aminopeptidase